MQWMENLQIKFVRNKRSFAMEKFIHSAVGTDTNNRVKYRE